MPEITLKYGLSNLIHYSPADEMNRRENTIIAIVMKLIAEDERGYTSAKYLSEHITDLGFKKTKQSILPYIELAKSLRILELTENSLKPYRIVKSKKKLRRLSKTICRIRQISQQKPPQNNYRIDIYIVIQATGGMPEMVFEYILKKNGMDPQKDLTIDQSIDFGSTAAAFTSDDSAAYTVEFEPSATILEKEGAGYVVASLGEASGYVPYTSYSTKASYMKENPEIIQKFTDALQKGMDYVQSHTPEEIAEVIAPQFKETDLETITAIVKRYYDQDTWKENLIFEKDSFELLQDILEDAGELTDRTAYENLVHTEYAQKACEN